MLTSIYLVETSSRGASEITTDFNENHKASVVKLRKMTPRALESQR